MPLDHYSRGDRTHCRICFVSGYPSDGAVNTGNAIGGQSGDLLVELCSTAGITLDSVYFTHVVHHRVTSAAKLIKFGTKNIDMSEEYSAAEVALAEELSLCSANVFVPLDELSLYTLTRCRSISKYRGSILESSLLPGRKVIPTLSPAACWRNYLFRHYLLHDLVRIRKESLDATITRPFYVLTLQPDMDTAIDYIRRCASRDCIGYDIETARGQLDCFSLAESTTSAISIPIVKDHQPYFTLQQEAHILRELSLLLKNPNVTKVLQNGIYDTTFMFERYGMTLTNMEDTMIAHGLLLPDFPKSLAFLCSMYTRHPFYKDDGKQRFKGFATDDHSFWRYSAQDALATLEVWSRLRPELEKMRLMETYRSHVDLIEPLLQMQYLGSPMDSAGMLKADLEGQLLVDKLKEELNTLCGGPINPASPKQLCAYFYKHKAIAKYYANEIPTWPNAKNLDPYLEKGKPTTDVTAMRRLRRRGIPEADILLKIRGIQKFSSTYLRVQLTADNRLTCAYGPIGTTTGRLSSKASIFTLNGRKVGCNRQNLPHKMDRFTLCRPDMATYNIDLSGAENRIVAYYGPVPAMISAFEAGIDVHALTASMLFGIPLERVSSEPGSAGIPNSTKSQRDMGKMVNHSGNYGVGARTLALKNDMPESVVKPILGQYHQIYPEVQQLFQAQIINQLRTNNRVVTNVFGRRRKFMNRWGDDLFQTAFAFPAQSGIADIINRRGLNFITRTPALREVRITNQVHDSLKLEIPLHLPWSHHARCLNLILDSLEQPLSWQSRTFSIPCDTELHRHTYDKKTSIKLRRERNETKLAIQLQRAWETRTRVEK